jgi:hypothetical protein
MTLADTVKAVELMEALGAGARAHPANRAVANNTQPDKWLLRIKHYLTRQLFWFSPGTARVPKYMFG